jgi:hypothetical protein
MPFGRLSLFWFVPPFSPSQLPQLCISSTEENTYLDHHLAVMNILEKAAGLGQKAGPGGWNDLVSDLTLSTYDKNYCDIDNLTFIVLKGYARGREWRNVIR